MATTILFTPPQPAITETRDAAADYSANQFYGMSVNTSGQFVLVSSAATAKAGILLNAPESGGPAIVQYTGWSNVVLGATFSAGRSSFRFGTDGRAVVATTGQSAAGYVTVTASTTAGNIVECLLEQHLAE